MRSNGSAAVEINIWKFVRRKSQMLAKRFGNLLEILSFDNIYVQLD